MTKKERMSRHHWKSRNKLSPNHKQQNNVLTRMLSTKEFGQRFEREKGKKALNNKSWLQLQSNRMAFTVFNHRGQARKYERTNSTFFMKFEAHTHAQQVQLHEISPEKIMKTDSSDYEALKRSTSNSVRCMHEFWYRLVCILEKKSQWKCQ